MASSITVKFYKLHRANDADPMFADCVQRVAALSLAERVQDVGNEVMVRLDQYSRHGELLCGEVVRLQNRDLPYLVPGHGDPAEPLDLRGGNLGHGAAFCFHVPTSTLAAQASPEMSVARIGRYFKKKCGTAGFLALPVIRRDAWERFINGQSKYFEIKAAPIDDFSSLEGEETTLGETVRNLKNAYGGAIFTVQVAMGTGNEAQPLNQDSVVRLVRSYLPRLSRKGEVRGIRVRLEDDAQPIDFLVDQLKDQIEIDLPENDSAVHYARRESALRTVLARNLAQITGQGQSDDDSLS